MPITILCSRERSQTAKLLRKTAKNTQVKSNIYVNWTGMPIEAPEPECVLLNKNSSSNKLHQLEVFLAKGIPTVEFSLLPKQDFLPRRKYHQQGFDFTNERLLEGRIRADFFVKRENIVEEYRLHVFRTARNNMRVLRIGKKVPRKPKYHPWIRTHRLGWKLSYSKFNLEPNIAQTAREAVRSLDLDFGAVDMAILDNGKHIVLEVNTCPGLEEGGTLRSYIDNIVERGNGV